MRSQTGVWEREECVPKLEFGNERGGLEFGNEDGCGVWDRGVLEFGNGCGAGVRERGLWLAQGRERKLIISVCWSSEVMER